MDLKKLIEQLRSNIATKLAERDQQKASRDEVRQSCLDENRAPTEDEAATVLAAEERISAIDAEVEQIRSEVDKYEREIRADEAADRLSREVHPMPTGPTEARGDATTRLERISEPRTYSRESDPKGVQFVRDVAASALGVPQASQRLARHMDEELVERAAIGAPLQDRAVGTGAFTGLVVPQYLVDEFAPYARAARPFADACRRHDLPAQGMTVNIGKLTTGTTAAVQSSENSSVSETNSDDTLLTINVQTIAGQQTVSRQSIERGAGIEDTIVGDLISAYNSTLDSTLLNQATTGLTNVATAIAYTDGTPTAAELYPKLLAAPAAVEALVLNQDQGDTFAVMHSRRWYWINSQLTSTWPILQQAGVAAAQAAGVNYGERYGSGFRGILPNGTPVIVDNNIATNLGAGTNEDEIYFPAQSESHLWEDPNAPMLIRAEQAAAATLGVLLVVYGYAAYTFTRRAHAQKIGGTGLVTPTF